MRVATPVRIFGYRAALALLIAVTATAWPRATNAQDDWSEIVRDDPATGMVALTFDAGAEAGTAAPQVIQVLRERGVHATFFLSGNWVLKYPVLATEILNDGHEIANHSLTHPELTRLSDNQIVFE